MARYDKTFTVRLAFDGRLEVFQDGRILYKISSKTWAKQIQEWNRAGWEIIWQE